MRLVWMPHPEDTTQKQGIISDNVWNSFINGEVVLNSYIKTNVDCVIAVLAWIFDINYKYSVEYCMRLKHLEGFEKIMNFLQVEPSKIDIILNTVKTYIKNHFDLTI